MIDDLARAGTEGQLCLWLRHFERARIIPFLCLLNGFDKSSRELEPSDVPVVRFGVRRLLTPHTTWQAVRFWSFLRKNRIQVVHTFFPDSTRFAAPIARAAGMMAVYGSRRDLGYWMTDSDARIARFYNRWFIDKVVANCEAARVSVIDQEQARPEDVIVIPNGINLERFDNVPTWQPKAGSLPSKIGVVSNLREVKGIDVFIRAAGLVLKEHQQTQFEIGGGGDPTPCQRLIDELGLTGNVRLLGPVNNVPKFLATLDVAVLPSRAEGLSNSLLEYMAAGRPIVATDVGGNSELLQDNTNGLLVTPNDSVALAEGIKCLLGDPLMASCLAAAGRASARHYSVPRMLQRLEDLYCMSSIAVPATSASDCSNAVGSIVRSR